MQLTFQGELASAVARCARVAVPARLRADVEECTGTSGSEVWQEGASDVHRAMEVGPETLLHVFLT
jgi:hypothetical protein